MNSSSSTFNPSFVGIVAKDSGARVGKVLQKVEGLKTDKIGSKNPVQYPFSPVQASNELARWERRLEEEDDVHIWMTLPKEFWQKHQIMVVNHHHVARLVYLADSICKCLIHSVVVVPPSLRLTTICGRTLLVVEQCTEIMFGIASPSRLLLQLDSTVRDIAVVCKPDWQGPHVVIIQLLFKGCFAVAGNVCLCGNDVVVAL